MKKLFIIGAVVVAVILGVVALTGSSSSSPTTKQVEHFATKYWNKGYPELAQSGESASCIYDPSKWHTGYKFTCFIFATDNTQIGHIVFQVLDSTASQYQFEYADYLY